MKRSRRSEGGYLLVTAVFLLLVVGLLVAAIAELGAGEATSGSMRVQSARALHAAQAGLELAMFTHAGTSNTSFDGGSFSVTKSGRTYTSTGMIWSTPLVTE